MDKSRDFHVRPNCAGMTVFFFLQKVLPHKRSSEVSDLIHEGFVELNGALTTGDAKLRPGDYVSVDTAALKDAGKPKKHETLEVLYRDEALICVLKPAGLSVIPDRRQIGKTAVQIAREMFKAEGLLPRPVHRLDKWTSGILVLALRKEFVEPLGRLFSERKVDKTYLAFVRGRPDPAEGVIDVPVGPDAKRMTRMVVNGRKAKLALTRYRTIRQWQGFSLLEVKLETGRTHQIRVHLAHLGHPICCDALYGGGEAFFLSEIKLDYRLGRGKREQPLLNHQALHAYKIAFPSPHTGKLVSLEAGLPHDLEVFRKKLDQYAEPSH